MENQVTDGRNSVVVYSQEECDKQLWGKCNHTEIDWGSAGYHVLDRQEYLERYYSNKEIKACIPNSPY